MAPASCALCPRLCRADRAAGATGICGADDTLRVARAALHMWEEPPISGEAGSGTIFFSGCSLKCVFCQNHEISTGNFGLKIEPERLVQIMLELQDQGALNINLVTATHYAHLLPWAIGHAREEGLSIPIVYNTSGYELERAVRDLGDLVDVWLTDYKYASPDLAAKLSNVRDYPDVARRGLAQMCCEIRRRGGVGHRTRIIRAECARYRACAYQSGEQRRNISFHLVSSFTGQIRTAQVRARAIPDGVRKPFSVSPVCMI